jgi:hypothetical protein
LGPAGGQRLSTAGTFQVGRAGHPSQSIPSAATQAPASPLSSAGWEPRNGPDGADDNYVERKRR